MAKEAIVDASQVLGKSLGYLNNLKNNRQADFLDVPDKIQPYINQWIRDSHRKFIELDMAMKTVRKDTDEYTYLQNMVNAIGKSWVTARKQIDIYKEQQDEFRSVVPRINAGTQEDSLMVNATVYGNEWDALGIDDNGEFAFIVDEQPYKLNNMPQIIDEPFVGKNYIIKLAEQVKALKDQKKPFDANWIYRNILDNISKTGAEGIIGLAHTDLAGDGVSKTFAELWEEGLADKTLYSNPKHTDSPFKAVDSDGEDEEYSVDVPEGEGEPLNLPPNPLWMKLPENAEMLKEKLAQFYTNVAGDIYGAAAPVSDDMISMRRTLPGVEITGRREIKSRREFKPARYETLFLPEDDIGGTTSTLNSRVNKYLRSNPGLSKEEKIKRMPRDLYRHYTERLKSTDKKDWQKTLPGSDYYALLKEMDSWRKTDLTPSELIKKYS